MVDVDAELLDDVLRSSGATSLSATEQPSERALIWKGRSAFSAVGWLAPTTSSRMAWYPHAARRGPRRDREMSAAAGLRVANVFHAGDGNLHPLILFDGRAPGALDRATELAGDILRLCVSLGGSITGEHGVGIEKRASCR